MAKHSSHVRELANSEGYRMRRGELFALRWRDVDETSRSVTIRGRLRGAIRYAEDRGGTATDSTRRASAWQLLEAWRQRAMPSTNDALVFATVSGKPIAPNNVLRC